MTASLIGRVLDTPSVENLIHALTGKRFLDRLGAAVLALTVLGVSAYGWFRPDYNWDLVAYVAAALEPQHADPASLHRATYEAVGVRVTPDKLRELREGDAYRLAQWQSPEKFQSQLGMYRVKVLYVELIRWLTPLFGAVNAAILLGILPALAFGALILWWLRAADALQAGLVLAPALMVADFRSMVSASTPDMLVSLVSIAALYALWKGRDLLGCAFLLLSAFVRPDSVILVFAILIAAVLYGWRWRPILATFVLALIAAVLIGRFSGHPGWWPHFVFSTVEAQASMSDFHPAFSTTQFLRGYARGILFSLSENDWPWLLILSLAGWTLVAKPKHRRGLRTNALIFALAIGALGKFASFPLPDDRFYFGFTSGLLVLVLVALRPRFDRESAYTTASAPAATSA
ncbi:hypothetical protein NGM99_09750 [Mesorhizobium sp. RP14(2022)]|uniref:DUF2029 domain-containing protein n=1 Tax=Mesorhizobium liriopis TaxID=2953882 RepID=A0ABT1C5H3_9HYPH|nr:hypothetical protein [Mesorhizobium liriopis]MCO6050074.1 hypothetical protein [Mesorhizobium liriopis]